MKLNELRPSEQLPGVKLTTTLNTDGPVRVIWGKKPPLKQHLLFSSDELRLKGGSRLRGDKQPTQ